MRNEKRKTKNYYQTKSATPEKLLEKQKLRDLEHLISMDLGNFLVLLEEGNAQQIDLAKQKTRSDLLKFGPDMQKIAAKLEGNISQAVDEFLSCTEGLLQSAAGWVDEAKVSHCFHATQKLEKALR